MGRTLELIAVLNVLKRRWWLILIPAVVALLLSLSGLRAALSPVASYNVAVKFTASARPTPNGTFQDQSYTPWLASEYAVNSIAAWMRTESFARELATALDKRGKSIPADTLRGAIVSDSGRSLMTFYLSRWPDAADAVLIGQAAIDVLTVRVDAYFPQFAAEKAVIVPLDNVQATPNSTPITERLSPLLRVGIGLALGIMLAFAVETLDRTVRGRPELESLGLAVIAEIPMHR